METLDRNTLPPEFREPFPAPDLHLDRVEVEKRKVSVTLHLGPVELPALLPYFGTVGLQAFITSALAAGHLAFGVRKKSAVTFFTQAVSKTPVPGDAFTRFAAGEPMTFELNVEEKRSHRSSSDPAVIRKALVFSCDNVLLNIQAEGHFSLSGASVEPQVQIYKTDAISPVLAPYLVEHACLSQDRYELVEGSCQPEASSACYRMTSCYNSEDFHLSVLQTDLLIQELAILHARQAIGLSPRHRLGYSIRFNALTTDPDAIFLEVRCINKIADRITYAFTLGANACTGTIDLAL